MTVTQDAVGRRVVLSPQEALVAGGPAEEFEQRVQALFRDGSRDLLVDLRRVPTIDSRGVRVAFYLACAYAAKIAFGIGHLSFSLR